MSKPINDTYLPPIKVGKYTYHLKKWPKIDNITKEHSNVTKKIFSTK